MVSVMPPYMDVESSRSYIDQLYSTEQEKCLNAVIQLKNSVIGSNRQKTCVIQQGVVPRLLNLLVDVSSSSELQTEITVTIGSLAKGTDDHVNALIEAGVVPLLINGLGSNHTKLVEVCLRALRTIYQYPTAPVHLIYADPALIPHLLVLVSHSVANQESVMTILTHVCKNTDHQNTLFNHGVVQTITSLLCSPIYRVQMPSLTCLANLCYNNNKVSAVLVTSSFGGKSVPDILVTLMARDKPIEMQMASAKCITYMHRAGVISAEHPNVVYKSLPTLVHLCKSEREPEERIMAAETLAYLIEVDTELQRIASISDHLIATLAEYLKFQSSSAQVLGLPNFQAAQITKKLEYQVKLVQDMKQAAFKAYASLAANDEGIRKTIIETEGVMDHIVSGLVDSCPRIQLAAVRCLHSLSRSVQQLRTTFQDHSVWKPLMKLLQNAPDVILIAASSTLCNLLLEFSPSKEPILESGAIDLLCNLTHREEPALRLNGIWALMNMAFQAEQKIKSQILNVLSTDQIFRLLSDPEVDVLMKTLGLLRNLLSTKPHIDHIMGLHGKQIMQAVILILEGDHSAEVKEQALCILSNIADGDSAKDFIMSNEDVLKKLTNYMMHTNVRLQIAATFCICNLIWTEEEGAADRQARLKDMGVYKLLHQLLQTSDTILYDKVKTAVQHFRILHGD